MTPPGIAILPRRSMVIFAALAILMTIFSYLFLFDLAVASVYLPFLLIESGTVACALIWSVEPRRDQFTPPDPQMDRASQPRLFNLIASPALWANRSLTMSISSAT